jgi:hypothetical protein
MLVLMLGGIYELNSVEMGVGVFIYVHKFHKYQFSHSKVNRVDTHTEKQTDIHIRTHTTQTTNLSHKNIFIF